VNKLLRGRNPRGHVFKFRDDLLEWVYHIYANTNCTDGSAFQEKAVI
jgi:hypothetical protein